MWIAWGEGGGSKMSNNDPHYTSKLIHVWGGEGSEIPKNRSTWFVDDPKCKTGCPLSTVELFEFYMATAVIIPLCYFLKTWGKNVSKFVMIFFPQVGYYQTHVCF